jgi:predicted ester cyclase
MSDSSINKRAVLDYLTGWETRDLAILDRVLTPEFTHEMNGRLQTRQELFEDVAGTPWESCKFHVDALVEENDKVACRYRFRGETPDGRSVSFTGMFIACMANGRLASGWGEYDTTALAAQVPGVAGLQGDQKES